LSKHRIDWADNYFEKNHGPDLAKAHQQLEASFRRLFPGLKLVNLVLIVCFDEASYLCKSSANTRKAPANDDALTSSIGAHEDNLVFSNFRSIH
jgi:hypothetical protein